MGKVCLSIQKKMKKNKICNYDDATEKIKIWKYAFNYPNMPHIPRQSNEFSRFADEWMTKEMSESKQNQPAA